MARQRRRDPVKERFWRRMVRDWKRSGLSVRDFCDWQDLPETSFFAWRRQLANRDEQAAAACSAAPNTGDRPAGRNGASAAAGHMGMPAFVPVRVVADAASVSLAGGGRFVEVQLPTGVQLRVPSGFDRQTLSDVLAALETRPC